MSVRVSNAVWDHSKATGNDLIVLLKIADEADDNGTNAYPGLDNIATKSKIPKRSVMRCIDRLESMGELVVTRPAQPGRGRFNTYQVVLPGIGDTLTPIPIERARIGDRKARKGDTPTPLTSDGAEYPGPRTLDLKDSFARFWSVYPLHKAKGAALRAWNTASKKADADTIIAGAERYAAEVKSTGTMIAYPATWLNGERWDDEPGPAGLRLNGPVPPSAPTNFARIVPQNDDRELVFDERGRPYAVEGRPANG